MQISRKKLARLHLSHEDARRLYPLPMMTEATRMNREFHVMVSRFGNRFVMKELGGDEKKEFTSLFQAARHARAMAGSADGALVIYEESGKTMNRIPFKVASLTQLT